MRKRTYAPIRRIAGIPEVGTQCINCTDFATLLYEIVEPHWSAGSCSRLCEPCFKEISSNPAIFVDWVYFIRGGDYVKIGRSKNPEARLVEISTGSPFPLDIWHKIPGGHEKETELHKRFAADRTNGEWFRLSPEIRVVRPSVGRPGVKHMRGA